MKIFVTVLVVLAVFVVAGLFLIYSGAYDISTSNHDNRLMNWALDTAMTNSVKNHAEGITPPNLEDLAMVREGAAHYQEMCVGCHGAPGREPGEMAEGLWPTAPELAEQDLDWTAAQTFWIVKNGIKFTAMPAWGPSHSDDELWAIVALLERLPHLSPSEYQAMVKAAGPMKEEEPNHESGLEEPGETKAPGAGGS